MKSKSNFLRTDFAFVLALCKKGSLILERKRTRTWCHFLMAPQRIQFRLRLHVPFLSAATLIFLMCFNVLCVNSIQPIFKRWANSWQTLCVKALILTSNSDKDQTKNHFRSLTLSMSFKSARTVLDIWLSVTLKYNKWNRNVASESATY